MQLLLEFLLEIIIQFFAELLVSVAARWGKRAPALWLAIAAYAVIAALLGIISLALLPTPFIHRPALRWLNLLLTPLLIAALFSLLGRWQSKHGKPRGQLTFFACAWLFAFSFAAARMFMQV